MEKYLKIIEQVLKPPLTKLSDKNIFADQRWNYFSSAFDNYREDFLCSSDPSRFYKELIIAIDLIGKIFIRTCESQSSDTIQIINGIYGS